MYVWFLAICMISSVVIFSASFDAVLIDIVMCAVMNAKYQYWFRDIILCTSSSLGEYLHWCCWCMFEYRSIHFPSLFFSVIMLFICILNTYKLSYSTFSTLLLMDSVISVKNFWLSGIAPWLRSGNCCPFRYRLKLWCRWGIRSADMIDRY